MPSKQVSVRELTTALRQLGFVEKARRGSHLLLQHPDKGVVISLPTGERYVRLIILRGIEKSLESFNVVDRQAFRKMLEVDG